MYSWLNGFYYVINGKYSITLLFFGSNTQHALLLRKAPPINSIARKCCTEKLKGSRICLIGYSGFIGKWFLIARGRTDTHAYRLPGQKQFQDTRRAPG